MREVVNSVYYVLRGGIVLRLMSDTFPPLRNKTDRNDACAIAQVMRTGRY
jgi:hypothetical protein